MAELKTRRPTRAATWPRVLVSGEEGTDAARLAAELTGDERLVASYWLEIGTDSRADAYGAVPRSNFDIIDHDGTWLDLYTQLCAAWDEAHVAAEVGLPSALIVTSMSGEWSMHCDVADRRARRREAAALTARGLDPAAAYSSEVDVEIVPDLWMLMGKRHRQFMAKILTWPGPVVMTAREKQTPEGRWVLKAQDQLGFDVTAWVRLTRDDLPEIVSLDTTHRGLLTKEQRAALRPQFTLARLIWEWSGCDADTRAPAVRMFDGDQVMPDEQPSVRLVRPPVRPRPRPVPSLPVGPPSSDEPLPSEAERVAHFTDAWRTVSERDKVQGLWARMDAEAAGLQGTDVSGLLSPEDRTTLGVEPGVPFTLRTLADTAARHVMKTATAICPRDEAGVA